MRLRLPLRGVGCAQRRLRGGSRATHSHPATPHRLRRSSPRGEPLRPGRALHDFPLTIPSEIVIIITVLKQTLCEVSHLIPVLAFVQHYKKFYTSQFESAAVRHGLNQLEIDILLFLHNNPDCRTASDICRYRGLAKSNVSKAVEHLRTMGLLTVSPAADNRRQRMLGFTDAAAPLVQELHAIQQATTAAVTADLTPAEAQAMQDYMARMDATLCRRLAEKGETL